MRTQLDHLHLDNGIVAPVKPAVWKIGFFAIATLRSRSVRANGTAAGRSGAAAVLSVSRVSHRPRDESCMCDARNLHNLFVVAPLKPLSTVANFSYRIKVNLKKRTSVIQRHCLKVLYTLQMSRSSHNQANKPRPSKFRALAHLQVMLVRLQDLN